jgi:hypothetical protein
MHQRNLKKPRVLARLACAALGALVPAACRTPRRKVRKRTRRVRMRAAEEIVTRKGAE